MPTKSSKQAVAQAVAAEPVDAPQNSTLNDKSDPMIQNEPENVTTAERDTLVRDEPKTVTTDERDASLRPVAPEVVDAKKDGVSASDIDSLTPNTPLAQGTLASEDANTGKLIKAEPQDLTQLHDDNSDVLVKTRPEAVPLSDDARAENPNTLAPQQSEDAPTVKVPARLVKIAERFNAVRMVDVDMAHDTPETIAFRSYLGDNQIRGGDALEVPSRAPDLATTYGRWWITEDGTIIGHPIGVENLLYRLSGTDVIG